MGIIVNNLSTAGASAANDIGNATGGTTGEKINSLLPSASTSSAGKVQLASTGEQNSSKVPRATGSEIASILTAGGYSYASLTHASRHQNGGADEIATGTPGANAIPKADGSGKLDLWVSDASASTKGKVQLAVASELVTGTDDTKAPTAKQLKDATALDGFWLTKRTKMPDGATAVFSEDAFAAPIGVAYQATLSVYNGVQRATYSSGNQFGWYVSSSSPVTKGKFVVARIRANRAASIQAWTGNSASPAQTVSDDWSIYIFPLPPTFDGYGFLYRGATSGDWFEVDSLWIGNYSYLPGTTSEEGSRAASQLGDTVGSGIAASATITSNGTNVSAGDTVMIAGKTYTFRDQAYWNAGPAEGDVLMGATSVASLTNLSRAIIREAPATWDGVYYKCATPHPFVYAVDGATNTLPIYAGLAGGTNNRIFTPALGISGNTIILAKSAATLTLSGSTLTGGKDAVGDKIHTQLQTMPATTDKYGAAKLAADGGTTAGTAVQANDSRLPVVGTFTPTVTAAGGGEATYTTQYGQYVKIGKLVHVDIHLNFNKNTLSGGIRISGLPYTSKSATSYRASANIPYHQGINVNANYQNIGGYISYGMPNIILVQNSFTNSTVLITDTNLSASSFIIVSVDYVID